jgi:hypothetical protein
MKKIYVFLILLFSFNVSANIIDIKNFVTLINTDFRESQFQNTIKPYASKFELERVEAGGSIFNLYKFRNDGVMINVANNIVLAVVMYKEGEKGMRQFNGKMPFKVNFTMNRNQIEKVIGPPTECIGATTINNVKIDLNCTYPYTVGVQFRVTYDSLNSLDYQTKPINMVFSSSINKAF